MGEGRGEPCAFLTPLLSLYGSMYVGILVPYDNRSFKNISAFWSRPDRPSPAPS